MVWGGICSKGKTKLRIVEKGAKINSVYYIENILKPFLAEDIPRLYPKNDYIFHQDSAPAHSSKITIRFLKDNQIKFIISEEWTPQSPDNAPMDYFGWGYIKKKLNRRKVRTLKGLKRALRQEWDSIPHEHIIKALKSWPQRCRRIYENKGFQFEKLLYHFYLIYSVLSNKKLCVELCASRHILYIYFREC
jgi:hypothetical protein